MGDFASRMAEYQSAKYPDRIRWEYREERNCTIDQLNAMGAEGWELVSKHQPDGEEIIGTFPSLTQPGSFPVFKRCAIRYILKRPKAAEPTSQAETTAQYMDRNGAMLKRNCCGALCFYSEYSQACPECGTK